MRGWHREDAEQLRKIRAAEKDNRKVLFERNKPKYFHDSDLVRRAWWRWQITGEYARSLDELADDILTLVQDVHLWDEGVRFQESGLPPIPEKTHDKPDRPGRKRRHPR